MKLDADSNENRMPMNQTIRPIESEDRAKDVMSLEQTRSSQRPM